MVQLKLLENNPPESPKVSVLVPVFNTSKYLPECLDSLMAQTLGDIEFICLNDGSTDESLAILREYMQRDSRFRIIDKENSGYGSTMNIGLAYARADYVGILESDDYADPQMFEKLLDLAQRRDCDLVKCNYYEHNDDGDVEQRPFDGFPYNVAFDPRKRPWILCILPIIWAALYRKSMIVENGIRFNETPGASFQDTSFVFQCWTTARRVALVSDALIHYRVDNTNSSVKSASKVFEVCGEYATSYEYLKKDDERYQAFGSLIHVAKLGTYKWNYERVDDEGKRAFAERMTEEYRAARLRGELDPDLFGSEDWAIVRDILSGPDTVLAKHPNRLEDLSTTVAKVEAGKTAVSVVVPIYNVERYLEQCLQSICDQTLSNIEIICVNDGSTDSSGDIIAEYADRDSRIKCINKANSGYGDSVNQGIALASGEYIGIVEPDDYIAPEMFSTLVEAAERHGLPDIVKGSYWRVCEACSPSEHLEPAFYLNNFDLVDTPFTLEENADFLLYHPSIWTAIYRKSFLDECNLRFYRIPGSGWADNPFLMDSLVSARSIVYVDEPLYYYREFSAQLSGGLKDPEIIVARWLEMDEIIKRKGVRSPRIIEGHFSRGCAYIQMLDDDFPGDPRAIAGVELMMERIDKEAVRRSRKIIRPFKRAYRRHLEPSDRWRFLLMI